jgi:beta-lactamase regulating signal transducer with metallopeptidase domain
MFAVRGTLVSFSIFALLYSVLSVSVCFVWRAVWVCGQQRAQRSRADLLFGMRMLPFVVAAGVTLILAVPSFLLLEPHAAREATGPMPFVLGTCGIALLVVGIWNAAAAWMRVSRMIAGWSREATSFCSSPFNSEQSVSVVRTAAIAPPLTAAGILRQSVWLSRAAELALSERELQSALRHEGFHVSRRDNLRKLMMRVVAFPGMRALESSWREATEMAADDAAVSNASQALDLAAALIKLSHLSSLQPPAELTTALVHSPAAAVNARVERLLAWKEREQNPAGVLSYAYTLCAATVAMAVLAVSYSTLLVSIHSATEWLVR